nr:murein hydrolase activator EnvC [Haemophilus parahaemolyticus]
MFSLFGLNSLIEISNANQLSEINQKIEKQKSKINENRQKRNTLQATLKQQEVEMGQVFTKLKDTESSLADIRASIKRTEQEIKRLEQQEKEQKERLKEQLESAYRSGIHPSVLERLMSDSAKNADRMTAYYEHINQVRIDLINDLRHTQEELKARRDELKEQQKGHQTQLSTQKKQEQDLKKMQRERENTLKAIDKTLEKDQSQLEELKANAVALQQKLVVATRQAEEQEKRDIAQLDAKKSREENRKATESEKQQVRAGSGLGSRKYPMPVSGKVVTKFGNGWNGVVISANAGIPVQAIASGKVMVAGWLQGYGNVVVISHGREDLSVYGYIQSILVKEGSRVSAGQTIATVGNSGGRSSPALYFGITRAGVAVNPLRLVR